MNYVKYQNRVSAQWHNRRTDYTNSFHTWLLRCWSVLHFPWKNDWLLKKISKFIIFLDHYKFLPHTQQGVPSAPSILSTFSEKQRQEAWEHSSKQKSAPNPKTLHPTPLLWIPNTGFLLVVFSPCLRQPIGLIKSRAPTKSTRNPPFAMLI